MADLKLKRYTPALYLVSFVLIAIGVLLTALYSKHYRHPVSTWLVVIILSVALIGFTYYWDSRDANAAATTQRRSLGWGFLIAAWALYVIAVYGTGTAARTDRVESCIPKSTLITSSGDIPNPDAFINFWAGCKGNDKILLDEPFKDYVRQTKKLPTWVMTPDGFTGDVGGWLQYYGKHPKNPYLLDSMSPEESQSFFNTRQLPDRILHPDK